MDEPTSDWLTIAEAASALKCSSSTIRRWITEGDLEGRVHEGRRQVSRASVNRMVPVQTPWMRENLEDRLTVFWDAPPTLVTPPGIAALLEVDVRWVRRWLKAGGFPSTKVGGRVVVDAAALIDLACTTYAQVRVAGP